MHIKKYLADYSKRVDSYLANFFSKKREEASDIDELAVEILGSLEGYISGGKKIRGALTVLGYQITGGKKMQDIIPVSAAVEIMHSALLIHDDFIDKDSFRRGKPTVHEYYAKGRTKHRGASMALIVGDAGIFLSNQILANSNFEPKMITSSLSEYQDLLTKTAYGEILDIAFDSKKDITWDELIKVRTYKTAYYTLVMPLKVGARLLGADKSTLDAMEEYGVPVGLAFQLADDILGVFGDSDVTGKSNDSDIRDGKKTFLFVKALELASKNDKEYLLKWYGSDELENKKVEKIRSIMKESGSLDFSRNLARKKADEGKKYIPQVTDSKDYAEVLSSLADFVVVRKK